MNIATEDRLVFDIRWMWLYDDQSNAVKPITSWLQLDQHRLKSEPSASIYTTWHHSAQIYLTQLI